MSSLTEIVMGFAEDEYKIAKTSSVFSKSAISILMRLLETGEPGALEATDEAIIYLTGRAMAQQ
jgi:hypothetical protein